MNKFDSFSIAHIMVYLSAMKEREDFHSDIVFWDELKEVLLLCKLNKLVNE